MDACSAKANTLSSPSSSSSSSTSTLVACNSPVAPPTPPPSPLVGRPSWQSDEEGAVASEGGGGDHLVPDLIKSAAEALRLTKLTDDGESKGAGDRILYEYEPREMSTTQSSDWPIVPESQNVESFESHDSDEPSPIVTDSPVTGKVDVAPIFCGETQQEMETAKPSCGSSKDSPVYHLKWVKYKGNKMPIVTQNENGPCPLLAIINVLILRGRLRLPSMMEVITANQLMEYLGDCIWDQAAKNIENEAERLNYEQNMHDAMAILPKLQTGLDVNVKFTGVTDFEFTPELIVFDLLNIPLYHGWLVDPETIEVQSAVSSLSYNQLVDRIITHKSSTKLELVTEALIAEQFLERTATQLTYYGLSELIEKVQQQEICVLFRNNHFITMYKHKNELFQLVTDQGFLTETNVVFETLNNIEGDGSFVDGDLVTVPPKVVAPVKYDSGSNKQQQVDHDYLIALTLQEENKKDVESEKEWNNYKSELGVDGLNDEELARRLQVEEEKKYKSLQAKQRQQQPSQPAAHCEPPASVKSRSSIGSSSSASSSPARKRGPDGGNESPTDHNGDRSSKSSKCSVM